MAKTEAQKAKQRLTQKKPADLIAVDREQADLVEPKAVRIETNYRSMMNLGDGNRWIGARHVEA